MNKNDEKKLNQLLDEMPKPQYDLDIWLHEDETVTFDRIVSQRRRTVWLWTAAAAVGLLVVVGTTTLFTRSAEADNDCVAVIYGEHTTDRAVVLAEMQKTMTTLTATDGSDVVEEQLKSMFSH